MKIEFDAEPVPKNRQEAKKYDEVHKAFEKLKPGASILITPEGGESTFSFRNRLATHLYAHYPEQVSVQRTETGLRVWRKEARDVAQPKEEIVFEPGRNLKVLSEGRF